MLLSSSRSLSLNKAKLLVLTATASVIFTVGCGMGTMAPTGNQPISGSAINGIAHGGRQAITGANVFVMAAGDVGYGSPAEILAETTTNGSGSFSFPLGTYTCPAQNSTPYSDTLYLIVAGGNPGVNSGSTTTNNTASVLLAVLGDCSSLLSNPLPFVDVNEVSTFAAMTAMQQFFNPAYNSALSSATPPGVGTAVSTENFGVATGNINGLQNAASTVFNLVNISTGLSNGVHTQTGNLSNASITIRPETNKMYAAANVLAACVNSTGSGAPCSTLYSDTGAPASSDVLMASYYMANTANATSAANVANVCALGTSYAPYSQSTYTCTSGSPADWTLGVTYGSNSQPTTGTYFLNDPTYLAVDNGGDIWVVNDATGSLSASNSLSELSPTGLPTSQALIGNLAGPAGIAIDPSSNIWIPNYGTSSALQTSVVEYTNSSGTNTFTTNPGPQQIISDGVGDIFVLEPLFAGDGDLEEILSGASGGTAATTIASNLSTYHSSLTIDANYTIWITGGAASGSSDTGDSSGYLGVTQFLCSTCYPVSPAVVTYPTSPSATTTAGSVTGPGPAITVDSNNDIFIPNYGSSTLSEFSGTTSITANGGSPFTTSANLTTPSAAITDGAGDIWVTTGQSGGVFEISNAGVSLSPSAGFAHTYNGPYGIAIDNAGNVWVGNAAAAAGASSQGFVTEIIGAAAPVITPISKGLPTFPGGPMQIGTRPLTGYNFDSFSVTECVSVCASHGTPGVPTIVLTEDVGDPLPFTTTLTGSVNGSVICTVTGTYSNAPGTQITCVGPPNSLTAGPHNLDGQLTGDGVEYGNNSGVIPFTVDP